MNYNDQRVLAASLLPELADVIKNEDTCHVNILKAAKPYWERILSMWQDDWPQEWAFNWARHIGDREKMIGRITESEWAYWWAYHIGNRETMKLRVTESEWAYRWACLIGDRETMKPRVTDPAWIAEWNVRFPDDKIT